MAYYIDSYPMAVRTTVRVPGYYQQKDILEPEEDPWGPRPVLDGCSCPMCGEGFMSDEEVTCAQLSTERGAHFFHRECLSDDAEEVLEALHYDMSTDTGAWMEAHTR